MPFARSFGAMEDFADNGSPFSVIPVHSLTPGEIKQITKTERILKFYVNFILNKVDY